MKSKPILARYNGGGGFVVLPSQLEQTQAQFVEGKVYRLKESAPRSLRSNNHLFAWLAEAWQDLPEDLMADMPSVEHMRKRALIMSGYRDEQKFAAATKAEAVNFAAKMKAYDDLAYISLHENIVIHWSAKSMDEEHMDGAEFQEAKNAIMHMVVSWIGVTLSEYEANKARRPDLAREVAPKQIEHAPSVTHEPGQFKPSPGPHDFESYKFFVEQYCGNAVPTDIPALLERWKVETTMRDGFNMTEMQRTDLREIFGKHINRLKAEAARKATPQ